MREASAHQVSAGPLVSWDHRPANDVANQYVRNHQDWAEHGARRRYPHHETEQQPSPPESRR